MLKITAVCNAGIYVESGETGILIDGIASDSFGFTGLSEDLFRQALAGEGLFRHLSAVCFTHTHPDHCDRQKLRQLLAARPELTVFLPDEKTPVRGCIQCGPVSVLYTETPHMPHTFEPVRHYVLGLLAEGKQIYVSADAIIDPALHRTLLQGSRPDCMILNPVYLTVPGMVELLRTTEPACIGIYHVPADPADKTGMRRKAERSISRLGDLRSPITLLSGFPQRLL